MGRSTIGEAMGHLERPVSDLGELVRFAEGELRRDLGSLMIRVIDEMPMTPTGKISRTQLRDMAGVA